MGGDASGRGGRGRSGIGDGDDSFRHYMSRKIDLQRRQFGLALPPPPPSRADDVDGTEGGQARGGDENTMIGVLGRLRNRHGTDDCNGDGGHHDERSMTKADGRPRSDLFMRGVVVIVNGYTHPDADALQRMLHRHGGDLEKYETSRITHVIASSLSVAKANMYKRQVRSRVRVVRPEWIVDCVRLGRLLPEADYVLDEVRDSNSSPLKRHLVTKRPPAPAAESGNGSEVSSALREKEGNAGAVMTVRREETPLTSYRTGKGSNVSASAKKSSSGTPRTASKSMSSSASSMSSHATPGEPAANVTATSSSSSSPPGSSSTSLSSQSDPLGRSAGEAVERSTQSEALPSKPSSSPSSSRSFAPQSKAGSAATDKMSDSSSLTTPSEIGGNTNGVASSGRKRVVPTGWSDGPTEDARKSKSFSSSSSPYRNANGSIRTVSTDPNFLETYFASSRLSFIGSFKQRNIQHQQHHPQQTSSSSSTHAAASSSSSAAFTGAEKRQSFVFHVDMDSFFASVVLRNYPQYKDKPVAIGHGWRSSGGGANGTNGPPSPSRPMPPPPRRPKQQRPPASSAASGNMDVPSKWSELADMMGRGDLDRKNYSTSELSTCNYIAREYGIKKGMFLGRARQLCPDLIVLPYDYEGYEEVSAEVSDILHRHADEHGGGVVEQISCDEFYVFLSRGGGDGVEEGSADTEAEANGSAARDGGDDGDPQRGDERRRREGARSIAESIRSDIVSATRCTASIGVGASRFLAKLATNSAKPDGCHVVDEWRTLLQDLKLRDLPGIGWKMERKLDGCGLVSVQDVWGLGDAGEETVCKVLGPGNGKKLMLYCKGEDPRSDAPPPRKTIGAECNYGVRFDGPLGVDYMMAGLAREVEKRMETVGVKGTRVTLKLKQRMEGAGEPPKFNGCGMCHNLSRSCDAGVVPTRDHSVIAKLGMKLFDELGVDKSEIRGMGIVISKLDEGLENGDVNSAMSAWLHSGKLGKRVRPTGNVVDGGHGAGVYDSREHPSSSSRTHAIAGMGADILDQRSSDGSVAGSSRQHVDHDRSENHYPNPKNALSTTGVVRSDIDVRTKRIADSVEHEMNCSADNPYVCEDLTSPTASYIEGTNGAVRVNHDTEASPKQSVYDGAREEGTPEGKGISPAHVQNAIGDAEVCDLLDDSDNGDFGHSLLNAEEFDPSPGNQSHSDEDIALPPLSQIDRNEVLALPQPMRDAIMKKIEARTNSEVGGGNRRPCDDHNVPPLSPPRRSITAMTPPKRSQPRRRKRAKSYDAEGGPRQVSVKRMLKLATVKSGQDTMVETLGEPVSLTQLEALPLRMQLQVVNGDEVQKELSPTRRTIEASSPSVKRTTEVRSPVFSEGLKAKDGVSPQVIGNMSASIHTPEVSPRGPSVVDEVIPESDFYRDNVVPLRKWMDSHPNPGQEEIDKFLEFVRICTAEKRLDEAAAMLRIVKRRRDPWGVRCYRNILDSFNEYLLATEDRRLDLKWHGLI